MKNVTSHTGILEIVKRMDNSVNGNPRFMLRCDGWTNGHGPGPIQATNQPQNLHEVRKISNNSKYANAPTVWRCVSKAIINS